MYNLAVVFILTHTILNQKGPRAIVFYQEIYILLFLQP